MKMKALAVALVLAACNAPYAAMAQSIDAPSLKEGDSWTYADTVEKGPSGWTQTHDELTIQRVTDSHIYFTAKQAGSAQNGHEAITDSDWGRTREFDGNEVVVNRPLAFPLTAGKHWEVQYTEPHPNPRLSSETWTTKYKVVGFEDVTVPAGTFHALKIEAEGQWRGELASMNTVVQAAQASPGTTTMVTQAHRVIPQAVAGQTYKAFWYVPEVGRWVKSVEEYYGSNGVRNERYTAELEAYKRSAQ
ncbi:hypothetical protein [Trinickia acidisoli]|uniref:hypothetical protein n=1 Tax=Trinickia acidisoli TaxID=2767482 RepID=UPI001F5CC97C|nr:hypothetical protein [Trinickia acidisoli]